MSEVALAFFWHQHQPYYPDDLTGENPMPWVRLHGVKDYCGMALHLAEVPEMRMHHQPRPQPARANPRLHRKGGDRSLPASRPHPRQGPEPARRRCSCSINFFMANPEHMIRPWPRFWELYHAPGPRQKHRPGSTAPLSGARPARSADALQSRLDSSAGLRARRRAAATARQGPALLPKRTRTACSTSIWRSSSRSFRCTRSWSRPARSN